MEISTPKLNSQFFYTNAQIKDYILCCGTTEKTNKLFIQKVQQETEADIIKCLWKIIQRNTKQDLIVFTNNSHSYYSTFIGKQSK